MGNPSDFSSARAPTPQEEARTRGRLRMKQRAAVADRAFLESALEGVLPLVTRNSVIDAIVAAMRRQNMTIRNVVREAA